MKKYFKHNFFFTFIEMAVSFAMLAVLLLVALQFFKTSEDILDRSANNALAFENAKTAFELITRDLHSIYYRSDNTIPFWHKPLSGSDNFKNQLLGFVAITEIPSQRDSVGLCEVKYQLWYDGGLTASTLTDSAGWMMRSVTDSTDLSSSLSNYSGNTTVGLTGASNAFTANNDSSAAYLKLIPYVTDLTFVCYDKNGNSYTPSVSSATPLPYSIEIKLTLLDRDAWNRWIMLGGLPSNLGTVSEPVTASSYRQKNQKTFNKIVFIGNRGQN